jgi:ketosteroid isomerase-like protein
MAADVTLEDLFSERAIRRILHAYCRSVDRGDISLMRQTYHDDATEHHGAWSGPADQFCERAMKMVQGRDGGSHHLTNILIDISGDTAHVESYFIAIAPNQHDGAGAYDMIITGRYLDSFERRDGVWKIAVRKVVFDWNLNLPPSSRWDGPVHDGFTPRGVLGLGDPLYDLLGP